MKEATGLMTIMSYIEPVYMSDDDNYVFTNATVFHLCGDALTDSVDKVRNHYHLTGKFLGDT